MPLTTHFWNWDAPVLEKAMAELTRGWSGGALDLSQTVILVPTAEAGRRLREALAVAVSKKDGAVVVPHVWHPEIALMHRADRAQVATVMQERFVWTAVLMVVRLEEYPSLFPAPPVVSREAWASGVAETLAKLRRTTGAGGLSLADVAVKLSGGQDAVRWAELERLEKSYLAQLAAAGVHDAQEVKRSRAQEPLLPDGVKSVCVFALADPTPLLRQWITHVAAKTEVTVWVHAPVESKERFDELGVPRMDSWGDAASADPGLTEDHIHLCAQPQDQARLAVNLLCQMAQARKSAAVGVGDPSLASHLEGVLAGEGVRAFDPAGRKASQHALLEVLRAWLRLAQSRTSRALGSFLRLDDVLCVVAQAAGFSQSGLLKTWDDFFAQRLPATLGDALELSAAVLPKDDVAALQKLRAVLQDVAARLDAWAKGDASSALTGLLGWIYGAREFATEDEDDRGHTFLFGEVLRLAGDAHELAARLKTPSHADDLLPVVLRELEGIALPDVRGEVDLVLHGWLELLWEPAAGLVVCGFNDESVPGKLAPDAFLPDHVLAQLGLPCQAVRRARDSYLLAALVAQRRTRGALHVIAGKFNDDGDVLRPSRLLFACDDHALPGRIRRLFPKETEASAAQRPSQMLAWKLKPWRVTDMPRSVSVSLLAAYLRCPLRCYLEKFLKMRAVDAAQREMTPGDFGGLVHEVLAAFGRDKTLRDIVSEKEIAGFFNEELDRVAALRWGRTPLLTTALQVESARQRLMHAARVQADLRANKWRIVDVEMEITADDGLKFADVPFTARLDRVDVHDETGVMRVWDYKTRHKLKSPSDAHSESARGEAADDEAHAWKRFANEKDKPRLWTDLQLPLYVHALRGRFPKAPRIEAGYIHLPAAVTESKAEAWAELNDDLIERARDCATEIVQRMKHGVFWPPEEEVRGDAFEDLLLGDAHDAVIDSAFWKGVAA